MARMTYTIILSPEAVDDLRRLKADMRSAVRDAIKTHLMHPKKASKSRIKRLRGTARPQYRLRVGTSESFTTFWKQPWKFSQSFKNRRQLHGWADWEK